MLKCPKCGGELTEEDGFFVCHACNSKFLAKKKSDASNQNDDGDNLKCPDCNSTPSPESANAGQEKNGDAQQSELDLLKARLAELEKKQEKVAKQSESSAKIKEKLAPVAVFFKKWGLKAVLPAALFLIAFITLLVCFCGLRGIYVNVNNPNEFYSFSPTSYEYHGNLLGEEYVDEGTWKTGGGMLSLTYEDEMFGKITDSYSFSHTGYDTVYITDSLGAKKQFKRVSILAYSTPQKTEYTLNLNGGSGSGAGENKLSIGSKIKEPSEPIREGYQFMGWYTTPDGWKTEGASQFNFNSRIWEDTTVYANWKDLITEYKLTGDMLPEEGVTFLEGDDLTQIYQSAGGVNAKIGNGSAVLEFKDENGKIVSGAAPRSNVTATLKEVVIGNNVSSIPVKAFEDCTSLTSVIIGDGVTSIGEYAFAGCNSLTSVTIPDSVTSIGDYAFDGCTAEIKWGNNPTIETISSDAFSGYKGTSITIPDSVTSIGASAFYDCTSINDVYYTSDIASWLNISFSDGTANPLYNGANLYLNGELATDIVIPDGVTSIGDWAFYGCTSLTSVTIPDGVTSIGSNAFDGCAAEIDWSSNPTIDTIGSYAFSGYKGTSITIPASVTSIGGYAFKGCTAEIKWGNNPTIETISSDAFSGYKGTSITIPDSVTSIGSNAFDGCRAEINWSSNPTIETISSNAFSGYKGTSITIPDSVTSIGSRAFYGCTSLTSVTIGNGVTSIGEYAFYDCTSLTSVAIGNGVTSIGECAFSGCIVLETITVDSGNSVYHSAGNCLIETDTKTLIAGCKNSVIPDDGSVTSIGDWAFRNCTSLTSVTIPDSVTSIGDRAFSGCTSLTSVTIGDGVTSIGDDAFYGCTGLTEINWNAVSVNDFTSSSDVFYNAGKEENGITVTFGDSVQKIPAYAFYVNNSSYYPNIKLVIIGNSVTSIGDWAFRNCTSLTSVTIPDSVTSIGDRAFSGCTSLTSVTIGDSVTSIGEYAFYGCTSLDDVYYTSDIASWLNISFTVGDANPLSNGANLYLNGELATDIIIPDGVTSIGGWAFYYCTSLTSVTIPDSVTSIGYSAFCGCTSLTSVTIGNSVTSIGNYAFSGCTSLTSVTIPDSVTSIGNSAFHGCTSLASVTIGNGVTSIGMYAFDGCTSLSSVTIPDSVTSIGRSAFYRCTSLTSVTIGDGVTSIGRDAFSWCDSLSSVTFEGTAAQWRAINKVSDWNYDTPFTEVVCSDGTVSV